MAGDAALRVGVLAALALLAFTLAAPLAVASTPSVRVVEWRHYAIPVSAAVLYDFDLDGAPELVADGVVFDHYAPLKSPYPTGTPHLVDYDCDGTPDLAIEQPGAIYFYKGEELLARVSVPPSPHRVFTLSGVVVGDVYIACGRVYRLPHGSDYVPVEAPRALAVVYRSGGALRVWLPLRNESLTVYPEDLKPLRAALVAGHLIVLAVDGFGDAVYVDYKINGTAEVSAYTLPVERVMGFSPSSLRFYVASGGRLYSIGLNSLLLVSDWTPVSSDEWHIYLYRGGELAVFDVDKGETVAVYRLPVEAEPGYAGGYPLLLVGYGERGSYLYINAAAPRIVYEASPVAIVGEPYTVYADCEGSCSALVDGVPVNASNITVTFKYAGLHNVTLIASRGLASTVVVIPVHVYPRHLKVALKVWGTPMPGHTIYVYPETFDAKTGARVRVACNASIAGASSAGWVSWSPIPLTVPREPPAPTLEITVKCGSGRVYEVKAATARVRVVPTPVEPLISYLGNGTIRLDILAANTSTEAPGTVEVKVGARTLYRGGLPAVFKLPYPGNYTVEVYYRPAEPYAYQSGPILLSIAWTGPVYGIPSPPHVSVMVVDHLVNKTRTVYRNVTVKVPETVVETRMVKTLDAPLAAFVFAAGIAGGYGLSIALAAARRRPEAGEPPAPTEEGGAGEVGVE